MNASEKAHNLGAVLFAVFIASGVGILAALTQRHMQESYSQQEHKRLSALVKTQRYASGLAVQVRRQRSELLASRSVGLLDIQPGPWESFTATWYAQGGINGNGITAVGKPVVNEWTVAADPSVIPLGSIVEVRFQNGTDRLFQALDTGAAIKGNRIDIYNPDIGKCFKNGRQDVTLRVLVRGR